MVQRSGIVDKIVLCLLRVIILLIKEWTKVYSLFDFCTVWGCIVYRAPSMAFVLHRSERVLLISTSMLVTKQ